MVVWCYLCFSYLSQTTYSVSGNSHSYVCILPTAPSKPISIRAPFHAIPSDHTANPNQPNRSSHPPFLLTSYLTQPMHLSLPPPDSEHNTTAKQTSLHQHASTTSHPSSAFSEPFSLLLSPFISLPLPSQLDAGLLFLVDLLTPTGPPPPPRSS